MAVGCGQHDARPRRLGVEEDGARAADAVLAADVRAGEAELVPEEIAEQKPRLDAAFVPLAVDRDRDGEGAAHWAVIIASPRPRDSRHAASTVAARAMAGIRLTWK